MTRTLGAGLGAVIRTWRERLPPSAAALPADGAIRDHIPPGVHRVLTRLGDATDAAVVSDLRRATGRFPHDARLAKLIRVLSAGNQRFADLWAIGTVAAHREDHTRRSNAKDGYRKTKMPYRSGQENKCAP